MTDQQRIAEIRARLKEGFISAFFMADWARDVVPYLLARLAAKDAEIEQLREAQRWRELEEEPCGDIGRKALLYGIGGVDEGEYLGEGDWKVEYGVVPGETFTHWIPLPAPPEKGAKHERD